MIYNINTIEIILDIHYISMINTHNDKSVIQIIIISNEINCNNYDLHLLSFTIILL